MNADHVLLHVQSVSAEEDDQMMQCSDLVGGKKIKWGINKQSVNVTLNLEQIGSIALINLVLKQSILKLESHWTIL